MPLLTDQGRLCFGQSATIKHCCGFSALIAKLRWRLPTKKFRVNSNLLFKFIYTAENLCGPLNAWNLQTHFKKFNHATQGNAHAFNPH